VLGGGREKQEDAIDPAVGLVFLKRIGDGVQRGEPLCTLHYNSEARLAEAQRLAQTAYRVGPEKPQVAPRLIYQIIGA
jgi:thymidine phosphorylase